MTYAFVQDFPASWKHYTRLAAALDEPVPEGLIFHVAGPTDEGFRTIELWETRVGWQRCQADRLASAVLNEWTLASPTLRELHALSSIFGERSRR